MIKHTTSQASLSKVSSLETARRSCKVSLLLSNGIDVD